MSTPLGINPNTNKNFTALIADDSYPERELLKRFLNSSQFEILADVPNGEAVLDFLKYDRTIPDIIFLDYHMSPKNALETIREIRPNYPQILIVVVTATSDKDLIADLMKYKINSFILKPFSKNTLDEKLIQLLGRKDLVLQSRVASKKKTLTLDDLSIPPLSSITHKVLLFEGDPSSGSSELEQIILPDKSICADVLRIANSAYYARTKKIQTIKDAITLLGLKTVKNIVMLQSKKQLGKNLPNSDIFKKFLNELPILTALVALDLSTPLGLKSLRDELFLSAMMCKIGMSLLAVNNPTVYSELLSKYDTSKEDLVKLEKEEFELSHIDVGLYIFKVWQMPPIYIKMMKNQKFKETDFNHVDDFDRVLRLADILTKRMANVYLPESEIDFANFIIKHYKAPPELIDVFGEDYYDGIKSHPFFDTI